MQFMRCKTDWKTNEFNFNGILNAKDVRNSSQQNIKNSLSFRSDATSLLRARKTLWFYDKELRQRNTIKIQTNLPTAARLVSRETPGFDLNVNRNKHLQQFRPIFAPFTAGLCARVYLYLNFPYFHIFNYAKYFPHRRTFPQNATSTFATLFQSLNNSFFECF